MFLQGQGLSRACKMRLWSLNFGGDGMSVGVLRQIGCKSGRRYAHGRPKMTNQRRLSIIAGPSGGHLGAILGYLGAFKVVLGVSSGELGSDFGPFWGSVSFNTLQRWLLAKCTKIQ